MIRSYRVHRSRSEYACSFFEVDRIADTFQPILQPLMRLASTSLQSASKEVLSTHDQFEVRLIFMFGDFKYLKTDRDGFLKVFDNPHAVSCSISWRKRTIDDQIFPASRTQPIRS